MNNQYTLGRIILLLIVIGIAVGGYRWWKNSHAPNTPGMTVDFGGSGNNGDIEFLTTKTKAGWVQQEIDAFNSQNQGKYHVTLKLVESREAMHAILDGKEKPAIWSPSSPVWISRLIDVWGQKNNGVHIATLDDPADYRVFAKSPLVLLTTQQKAAYFQKVFSSSDGWDTLRDLSLGRKKAPWGAVRFSHADPLNASSGMLTMSLILTHYAQKAGGAQPMEQVAGSGGFTTYLTQLEKGFVNDAGVQGSGALEAEFRDNPGSRDFITAYESAALESVKSNSGLAVVYPSPTAVAEQSAAVLSAPWVTGDQKAGAEAFLKFMASDQSLRDGLAYHFRPATERGDLSLAPQLNDNAAHGFRTSYTSIELPPYRALNEAANQWRVHIAHEAAQQ